MPRATAKRAGRTAVPGARFATEVLAANLRGHRLLQSMTQEEFGDRMAQLGQGWTGQTVGFVERGDRNITVDELLAAAVVLERTVPQLLDPAGPDGSGIDDLDLGGATSAQVLYRGHAPMWLRDRSVLRGEWNDDGELLRVDVQPRRSEDLNEVLRIEKAAADERRLRSERPPSAKTTKTRNRRKQ